MQVVQQHNERCKRFCSYFYLNSQAAAATVVGDSDWDS